jgi:hypothetical protein
VASSNVGNLNDTVAIKYEKLSSSDPIATSREQNNQSLVKNSRATVSGVTIKAENLSAISHYPVSASSSELKSQTLEVNLADNLDNAVTPKFQNETSKFENVSSKSNSKRKGKKSEFNRENFFYYDLLHTLSGYCIYNFTYEIQKKNKLSHLTTEKLLLEWPLPNVVDKFANKFHSYREIDLTHFEIKEWEDFLQNLNQINEHLDNNSYLYKNPDIRIDQPPFRYELTLQGFIQDILREIFSKNILKSDDGYDFLIGETIENVKEETDVVLVDKNYRRYLDIEVKNDPTFKCMKEKNLFDYVKATPIPNQSPVNAFKETINYIMDHKLKYGVLTSLENSWFFKIEDKIISISNTIAKDTFLKAMNYIIELSLDV